MSAMKAIVTRIQEVAKDTEEEKMMMSIASEMIHGGIDYEMIKYEIAYKKVKKIMREVRNGQ